MPYTRLITAFFFLLLLLLTVFLPSNHPFYTHESMLLAVIFTALLWLMSLAGNFVMDLLAYLFTGYFSQRIVIIYFFPSSLDYQDYLSFTPENFTLALVFLALSAFAALSGYLCSQLALSRPPKRSKSLNIASISILGKWFPFDSLFRIYAIITVLLILFQLYLIAFLGVGVTGIEFEREYAILFRISNFFSALTFLPFFVILAGEDKNRKMAILLMVLAILNALFRTSKGVILGFTLQYLICYYLVRGSIPKKYLHYAFAGLIVTIILYAPIIMISRSLVVQYILAGNFNFMDAWANVSFLEVFTFSDQSFGFLQRLGGFDWLLGVMNVGRESFPWWASLTGDLLMVLKTLVPGDTLMFIQDYVPVSKIIPALLRGWNMDYHLGHGELLGGAGMAYVYWGPVWGTFFFFVWVFVLNIIISSRTHIIVKSLIINFLLVEVFIGSGFITPLSRLYEAGIAVTMCYFIYWTGGLVSSNKSIQRVSSASSQNS